MTWTRSAGCFSIPGPANSFKPIWKGLAMMDNGNGKVGLYYGHQNSAENFKCRLLISGFGIIWSGHLKKRLDLGILQKDFAILLQVNTRPSLVHPHQLIEFLGYVPYFGPCRNLGQKIVRYREYIEWSQKALARHLGIDPGTFGHREKYKSKPEGRLTTILNNFFFIYSRRQTQRTGCRF